MPVLGLRWRQSFRADVENQPMKNNRPLEIILGGSVDMEAQSHGLSVAAIRNAQGKKNPGDFPRRFD